MSVDCILQAAQTAEGVRQVLIHEEEPRKGGKLIQAVDNMIDPPTEYIVRAIDQDAQVEQRLHEDGQVTFWVGKQGVGITPSLHTIEVDQAFYVRVQNELILDSMILVHKGLFQLPNRSKNEEGF
jgi:hypothetical protein